MFQNITKAKKLERAKLFFTEAVSGDSKFQEEAKEDFEFRNGNQWTDMERDILTKQLRPVLTFNLIKSSIDLLLGMSVDIGKRFRCSPVEKNDEFLSEVLNDILEWIYDSKEFDTEEISALESAAICGRGFLAIDFATLKTLLIKGVPSTESLILGA